MDSLWEWVSVVGGVAGKWVPEVGGCCKPLPHRGGMVWGEGGRLIGGGGGSGGVVPSEVFPLQLCSEISLANNGVSKGLNQTRPTGIGRVQPVSQHYPQAVLGVFVLGTNGPEGTVCQLQ